MVGTISLCISIGGLMVTPTLGSQFGWTSPLVVGALVLFVVFMIVFLPFAEMKFAQDPLKNGD